jgi:trigger factor
MDTKVEKVDKNIVKLEITVSKETFEEGLKKAYQKNASRFNIPGFRKGKAPMAFIEKQYGEGVFYEDAINFVFPAAYENAIKENNIDPVDQPELDIIQVEKGKEFIFTATVTVKPEVTLGQYKGIEVAKKEYNVTDEDVNKELDTIRERSSRLVAVEDRAVQKGDILTIDYKGFVGEEQFEGGTADNQTLEIGSASFIPGFEDQLIGANAGDNVEVKVSFPAEYRAENLAGKDAVFHVTVKEIKVKELPELDDELAKEVSEFDTLDELKNDIRAKKEEEAKNKAKYEFEDSVVKAVVDAGQVEIPEVMIESQIDSMVKDFDHQLRYQGFDLQKYLEFTSTSMEDFRSRMKEEAEGRVKTQLTLEAIAKEENIEAGQEEIEQEFEKLAVQYKTTVEDIKKSLKGETPQFVIDGIVFRKTIDLLVENSKTV